MNTSFNAKGDINITNSAVAVGTSAQASVRSGPATAAELQLAEDLQRLTERLLKVAAEVESGDAIVATAEVVTDELAQPQPRWRCILDALRRVGPLVAGFTGLTADIATIETAIHPLIPH